MAVLIILFLGSLLVLAAKRFQKKVEFNFDDNTIYSQSIVPGIRSEIPFSKIESILFVKSLSVSVTQKSVNLVIRQKGKWQSLLFEVKNPDDIEKCGKLSKRLSKIIKVKVRKK